METKIQVQISKSLKNGLALFELHIITESARLQYTGRFFELVSHMFRFMGIRPHGNNLTAQLPVTL